MLPDDHQLGVMREEVAGQGNADGRFQLVPCQHPHLQIIEALFNPKTSVLIQRRHPYTGNVNSETSGDSRNALLHCGDVIRRSSEQCMTCSWSCRQTQTNVHQYM